MTDHETHPAGAADLVKRLRDYEEYEQSRDGQITCVKSDMAQEAATYIEQLEAENRELAMQVLASGSQAQEAYEAQLKAEAATAAAYEVAAQVIAQGWCSPENSHKEMDFTLASAISASIRALATPDQTAALDKLIAEAVRPLEDALDAVLAWHDKDKHTAGKMTFERSSVFAKARAASKKGGV